jgi:hypothetical protein
VGGAGAVWLVLRVTRHPPVRFVFAIVVGLVGVLALVTTVLGIYETAGLMSGSPSPYSSFVASCQGGTSTLCVANLVIELIVASGLSAVLVGIACALVVLIARRIK